MGIIARAGIIVQACIIIQYLLKYFLVQILVKLPW